MEKLYHVWFVPLKGKVFDWKEKQLTKEPLSLEDANLFAYESKLDEQAPDRDEYMRWEVRPA